MLTLMLVLLAAMLVVAAGEAVRAQCRRMLTPPAAVRSVGSLAATDRWQF